MKNLKKANAYSFVPPNIPLFDYTDYRLFLSDFYKLAKSQNRFLTHRFIAETVGASSTGWFSDLVKGRISLTGLHFHKLVGLLGLSKTESDYFSAMVSMAQAASFEEREASLAKMLSFKEVRTQLLGEDKFAFYSHWYHAILRELLFIYDFDGDYLKLGHKLRPPISPAKAKESIELLKRLDLIKADSRGFLKPTETVLKKDGSAKALKLGSFLRTNIEMGLDALDKVPADQRDISSLSIVLTDENFKSAVEEVKALRKKLLKLSETSTTGKVYQCNFQIFPVTK